MIEYSLQWRIGILPFLLLAFRISGVAQGEIPGPLEASPSGVAIRLQTPEPNRTRWTFLANGPARLNWQTVDADKALQSIGSPEWYDSAEDGFASPRISKDPDNPIRTVGWEAAPKKPKQNATGGNTQGRTRAPWNPGFSGLASDWFSAIVLLVLAMVLVVILGLLVYYSLQNYLPGRYEKSARKAGLKIDPAKVVELPFEAQEIACENPLAAAEAMMREGNYRQAIVLLYGYQLLALDQARQIELQKGKTNRMYVRELGARPKLQWILEQTMLVFEDAYFGSHPISQKSFRVCWEMIPEFHQLAAAPSGATGSGTPEVVTA